MRIIFNIHSKKAAMAAGWRARAVQVNDRREADLEDVLKAVLLEKGISMYEYIVENGRLGKDWSLFVNGIRVPAGSSLKMDIRDNVQIHLMFIS